MVTSTHLCVMSEGKKVEESGDTVETAVTTLPPMVVQFKKEETG